MKTQTIALVALASSTQLVSATFGWLDAQKYSCPSNTDNVCVDSQKNGFDWTGLNLGSFGGFGGFDFSGFECASSFDGKSKRDQITGRTFQNKCIKGKATPEKSSAPSFGCGSSKDVEKFSVKEFQVSVEFDCDLEFHYDMPDGSVCKQKSSCKKSGTTVKNTQCGGAKNVHVIFPSYSNGGKKSCDVGFHHIGFDCAPPASTKPVSTPAYTPPAETTPAYTPPAETTSAYTPPAETTPAYTPPAETTPAYTPPAETTPAYTPPADTTSGETTPAYTPPAETTSGETTPAYTPPAETTSGETTPAYTPPASESTSIVPPPFPVNTTTSAGSVSETSSAPGTTELITSTILTTQVSTIISCADTVKDCPAASTVITTITTAVGITTTAEGVTSPPAETSTATLPQGPAPTAPCPAVLPQCLNTWLFSSGCKSNTDKDCFCSSSEFVDTIYECLSAHGASDEEVDAAQSYFQGICASYIPSNPAIVTGINTLTITASVGVTVPVTTVELITTVVVPCTQSEGPSAGSIIVGSSTTTIISTALTVPQVVFQTISGTSAAVSLVEGTAPAVATNPAAFPTQTTFSSVRSANETAAPTQPIGFTGAGSKTTVTFGTFFAAVLMAVLIM